MSNARNDEAAHKAVTKVTKKTGRKTESKLLRGKAGIEKGLPNHSRPFAAKPARATPGRPVCAECGKDRPQVTVAGVGYHFVYYAKLARASRKAKAPKQERRGKGIKRVGGISR